MNELINYEGDCRTAPATPSLLNIRGILGGRGYIIKREKFPKLLILPTKIIFFVFHE